MTPVWLGNNAEITTPHEVTPDEFIIPTTTGEIYQRVIRVGLVPPFILSPKDGYTVTILLADNTTTIPLTQDHDPIFGISDMNSYIGFSILDINNYPTYVPCIYLEGDVGKSTLKNVTFGNSGPMIRYTQFTSEARIQLRPSENWGSCHTEHNQGYVVVKKFQHSLDPSNGLYFEFYRDQSYEHYSIKYIRVDVELD